MRDIGLVALLAAFVVAGTRGQQTGQVPPTPVPSAPLPSATSLKPSLTLPPQTYTPPDKSAPEDKTKLLCDAPQEGVFAQPAADAKSGQALSYSQLLMSQIYTTWQNHLPREAHDAWAKGRIVRLRFMVMPNGSYSSPEVTISSGRSSYDYAAMEAVRSHDAFPPLPAGITRPLAFCMTFKTNTGLPDTPQGWYGPSKK